MKRRQKAALLSPISSKITEAKEKERRKRESEVKERRRREKSNGCALSFDNGYFNCRQFLTEKTVSFKLNFLFDRWEKN